MSSLDYNDNRKQLLQACRKQKFAGSLSELALLELFLSYNLRHSDVRSLAKRMLRETGSLYALTHLPVHELTAAFGIGEIPAVAIADLGAMADRIQMTTAELTPMNTLPAFYRHLKPHFNAVHYEKTVVICLNRRMQYIATEAHTLFHPTQTAATLTLILEIARKHRAANLVIAHNHPNERASALLPSSADLKLTENLREALAREGITLCEHLVMAFDGCISIIRRLPPYCDCGKNSGSLEKHPEFFLPYP